MPDLQPEDAKLVTLARSARGRTGAAEGAAVRDTDGRTYVAGGVALPSLQKRGYSMRGSLGSLAAGGTLGILIPPSVNMIVYGSLTTSIIVLLTLEIAATLLLLGAQVIAEYERFGKGDEDKGELTT